MRWWLVSIVGALIVAVGLVSSVVAVERMVPHIDPKAKAVESVDEVPSIAGSDVPAVQAVDAIIKALPSTMSGLPESKVAESRPVKHCITPVASRTRAWSGGDWRNPTGVVVTVSAYPAGMGWTAERCSQETTIRRGDVIAHVFASGTNPERSVVRKAMESHLDACVDPSYDHDQSKRNPNHAEFSGWITTTTVEPSGGMPPEAEPLQPRVVEVPEAPSYPHDPESLPEMPPPPQSVDGLTYPEGMSKSVSTRVPDPNGPGCGWKFTGMVPPRTDDDALRKHREEVIAAAQTEVDAIADGYREQYDAYAVQKAEFDSLNGPWEEWARQVRHIARQWHTQGQQWAQYEADVQAREDAINAHAEFVQQYEAARLEYEQALAEYESQPEPKPTPSSNIPGWPPMDMEEPEPTMDVPERPEILDQQPPVIPPEPTPPVGE